MTILPLFACPLLIMLNSRETFGYAESDERHILARQFATTNGPTDWHEALDIIALGLPEQVFYLQIFQPLLVSVSHFSASVSK